MPPEGPAHRHHRLAGDLHGPVHTDVPGHHGDAGGGGGAPVGVDVPEWGCGCSYLRVFHPLLRGAGDQGREASLGGGTI